MVSFFEIIASTNDNALKVQSKKFRLNFLEQLEAIYEISNIFSGSQLPLTLIVKVVVSKNIYFLFVQVIRYCSVPDVSINKLSTFIGNQIGRAHV